VRWHRLRRLALSSISGLLLLCVLGLGVWANYAIAARKVRSEFLRLAQREERDTVIFADWITSEGRLRAVDFLRNRSAVLYEPAPSEIISDASASPTSPLCVFLSGMAKGGRDSMFRWLKVLDVRNLRIVQQASLPDGLYAYNQAPAWSHDGKYIAIACASNRSGPKIIIFRSTAEGLTVKRTIPIPADAARGQPFLNWGADWSSLYVSRRGDEDANVTRSLVVDLLSGTIAPAPYDGQVVDAGPHGRLLLWLPDQGFEIADSKSGKTRGIGWPLGIGHRLWDDGRYLLLYGGYAGLFSLRRARLGPVPEQLLVYDTKRRVDVGIVDLWCGPPPVHISVTSSAWIGCGTSNFRWSRWSARCD